MTIEQTSIEEELIGPHRRVLHSSGNFRSRFILERINMNAVYGERNVRLTNRLTLHDSSIVRLTCVIPTSFATLKTRVVLRCSPEVRDAQAHLEWVVVDS